MSGKKARKAVVLLSGGIDSATTMAVAKNEGYMVFALTLDYGQKNRAEVQSAEKIAKRLQAERHIVLKLDLGRLGGSSLTGGGPVPRPAPRDEPGVEIPSTYVPCRNTIFLSLAVAWAEAIDAGEVFTGVNARDYSGYPDCRAEYIRAFEKMVNMGTRRGVTGEGFKIRAPLMDKTKAEIIKIGVRLGVDFSVTRSCYEPTGDGRACGECESCLIRKHGFENAGLADPAD